MILPMKTTKYIILTLAAMAALSCARMDEQVIPEESGVLPLTLDVRCGGLETRTPGEDKYNENKITHVDYFFFADEAGTQPLGVHGRAQAPESGRFLLEFDVENTAAYSSLKGTSYVYILANYPQEIDHSTNYTLETILGWPVNKKLYTAASGSTPASLPDSFVMDSYDPETQKYTVKLSPTKKDDVLDVANNNVKQINLSRLAVKLTVTLNFDQSIQTTDSFGNHETWTPEPEHTMEIYYVNALNNTTVQATPVKRTANTSGSYFSYPSNYPFTPTAKNTVYSYTTDLVYTYPQSWTADDNGEPYFKLHMSWRSTVKDVAQFYYKIPVPTERTLNRNCWYQVTVRVGVLGGTEEDYVVLTDYYYCVADWAEPVWFSGSGLNSAKYFYVPVKEFHIYGDDNISIPYYCNAAVNAYFTNITYIDYNSNNGSTATRSKGFTGTGNTSVTDYGGNGNHTYALTSDADNKVVKFTHSMADLYVQRDITLMIVNSENSSQSQQVVIHQHPAIELKTGAAGDVFVNGRFAYVLNATFGRRINNSNYYHSANSSTVSTGYGTLDQIEQNTTPFTTDLRITAFSETNNYYIANNNRVYYKIGDPRVKASSVYSVGNNWLNEYLYNQTTSTSYWGTTYTDQTRAWNTPGDILICSQSEVDRNLIAPHILVSSRLGRMGSTSLNFVNVTKRAATYQEAGYPAGRWRLPSEAEIAFIVARQYDGVIPKLFTVGSSYWVGSGRYVTVNDNGTVTFSQANGNTTQFARFVYDLWYWGNDPESLNVYHPNGHVE